MLKKFAVENYRGFENRIELDLSNTSNYEFNTFAIKNGIIKNGILYGPNGSGKTNFSLAIFDIVYHLTQKHKAADYYNNFVCAKKFDEEVRFEYVFSFDEQEVKYSYSKDRKGTLVSETLFVNELLVLTWGGKDSDVFVAPEFNITEETLNGLKENSNNVSIINFLLASFPLSSNHYLIRLRDFVDSMLWFQNLDVREYIGLESGQTSLEEYFIEKNLIPEFARFLLLVSDQKFEFSKPKEGERVLYCKVGDARVPFIAIASTGTRALELVFYWICKLKNASFVFVDEFDAFYHFKLSYNICKALFDKECQVFVSSHNTYLMTNELLRPDCNFIINNNEIKPLCDCTDKELRFGHNMEKLYRGNTFTI